jgi:hypothetical protein
VIRFLFKLGPGYLEGVLIVCKEHSPSAINTALDRRTGVISVRMPKLGSCLTKRSLPAGKMSSGQMAGASGTPYARSLERLELSNDRRRLLVLSIGRVCRLWQGRWSPGGSTGRGGAITADRDPGPSP